MWIAITPDGELREVEGVPTLAELQAAVGGFIQEVRAYGVVVVMDEDAKVRRDRPPLNPKATTLCAQVLRGGDEVLGPVAVVGRPDSDGETQGLTTGEAALVRLIVGEQT